VNILTVRGFTVHAVEQVEELEAMLQRTPECALLLTDVVMPKLNGRELAKRVVQHWPGIKVLYMSGYTADAFLRESVLHEGLFFLQKPFTPTVLVAKVREVLDTPLRPGA
jgi:DNA-binding NtrC family response regulator